MTRTRRSHSFSSLILPGLAATLAAGCSGGQFLIGQDGADASNQGQDTSGGATNDSTGGGTNDSTGGGTNDSTGGGVACGTTTCSSGSVCCYGPCGQGPARCMTGPACPVSGIACPVDAGGTVDAGAGCMSDADCAGGGCAASAKQTAAPPSAAASRRQAPCARPTLPDARATGPR
jgi:hypothetical protein